MGDQNSFNRTQTEPNSLQFLFQGLKRGLGLDPRIDQSPRRFINEIDVGALEGKRDGELDFMDFINRLIGHRQTLLSRVVI